MEQCNTLKEYMLYVEKVRTYAKEMTLQQAVEQAVEESIEEGILAEFLTRSKAEVVQMSIFEYDEEKEIEKIRKAEREAGIEEGKILGVEAGKAAGIKEGKLLGIEAGIAVSYISLIRKNRTKKIEIRAIAELLDVEEAYVKQVAELIEKNPEDTDEQLLGKMDL